VEGLLNCCPLLDYVAELNGNVSAGGRGLFGRYRTAVLANGVEDSA
jgi:hypothetical protein